MPYPAYHIGASGFFGLVFRRWLDIPVFLLANVVVDIEVLLHNDWPYHQHAHTLLIGAALGALWGLIGYRMRGLFAKLMRLFRLPHKTSVRKAIISGILGVWLHVVIDAIYHWDLRLLWPYKKRVLYGLVQATELKAICATLFAAAILVYLTEVLLKNKADNLKN